MKLYLELRKIKEWSVFVFNKYEQLRKSIESNEDENKKLFEKSKETLLDLQQELFKSLEIKR